MTDYRNIESEQALEALLQKAVRRVEPPANAESEVRAALYGEWRARRHRRRQWRRMAGWALAASVAVAAYVALNVLELTPAKAPQQVAQVDVRRGPVSILSGGERLPLPSDGALFDGQTIQTSSDASIAMELLSGGSIRLAANSRLRLIAFDAAVLERGQAYFDSGEGAQRTPTSFQIRTKAGVVRHVGTQFIAQVTDDSVIVRVREGRVEIDGSGFKALPVADGGVELYANGTFSSFVDEPYGAAWNWVAAAGPAQNFNTRRMIELLQWFSRETGRSLRFESMALEELANTMIINWPADLQATAEDLDLVLSVTDLRSALIGHEIVIRAATY